MNRQQIAAELVGVAQELMGHERVAARPMSFKEIDKEVMRANSKIADILYDLDISLGSSYRGDKGAYDKALHELRFKHVRAAMDAMNTGDLLDLLKKMKRETT